MSRKCNLKTSLSKGCLLLGGGGGPPHGVRRGAQCSPLPFFAVPSIVHLTSCRVLWLPAPLSHFPSRFVDQLVSYLWPFLLTY